jgi:hypothetical protein
MPSDINLLKSVYDKSEDLTPIQSELRKFSIWSLVVVVGFGIIILGLYFILSTTRQNLIDTRNKLTAELNIYKSQESIMAVIKSRINTVTKAMENTKPIDKIMTVIYSVSLPPKLTQIYQDDHGKYNISLKADSLSDAMDLTTKLIDKNSQNLLTNIMFDSFSVDKSGINLKFSFTPNWKNL